MDCLGVFMGVDVDTMAKLYAERLMRGDTVTEAEMRVIMAGLMLSVDRLAHAVDAFRDLLWSEDKLRAVIREEVREHCRVRCGVGFDGLWVVRAARSLFGRL